MVRSWRGLGWCVLAMLAVLPAAGAAELISQSTAGRFGLTRSWYAQVGSLRSTGKIEHMSLDEGMLLVQSASGMLTALDAENGRKLWAVQVGPPYRMCSEPAANDKFVVVVQGSLMYVLDRHDGHVIWQRQLSGTPGSGPGVTRTHAFVPMVSGLMEGYDLEKGVKQFPWNYKSSGRVVIPPMTTGQTVSWSTNKGYFYVAKGDGKGIRYRLETRGSIESRPAYWTPNLYACSTDGSLYAANEATGKIVWRYSLGDAIFASPVAIDKRVYVISETAGLYCLDVDAAQLVWNAPGIRQFVAASPSRVYGIGAMGRLVILDARSGSHLGAMPIESISNKVVNSQTDRIYLASDTCLVQCLHQIDLKKPVTYIPPPPSDDDADKDKPKRPATTPAPPSAEPPDAPDEPDPAMPAEDAAGDEAPEDDPFK